MFFRDVCDTKQYNSLHFNKIKQGISAQKVVTHLTIDMISLNDVIHI